MRRHGGDRQDVVFVLYVTHLTRGFNETEPGLLREVEHLLLIIHLQLFHQFEGVHVSAGLDEPASGLNSLQL